MVYNSINVCSAISFFANYEIIFLDTIFFEFILYKKGHHISTLLFF